MQRLEVSGAVRHIYGSLGVKGLILGELGVQDQQTDDHKAPDLTYVISVCAFGPNRKHTCQNQNNRRTETTNSISFPSVPLDFLRKRVESVFSMLQKECAKC